MSLFPTEKVQETAEKTVQKKQQPQQQRQGQRQPQKTQGRQRQLSNYRYIDNIEQLYQTLIVPPENFDFETINDYMAAGFLDEKELRVVRGHSIVHESLQLVEKMLGMPKNEAKLERTRRMNLNTILSICHSSKSRDGAAYQTLITQKTKNVQRFRDETPQEDNSWFGGGGQNIPDVGVGIPKRQDVSIRNDQTGNSGF